MLSNFMQVLNSRRKHHSKVVYFPKHILFIIIYLLQEQKLNIRNYSEQEINMRNFIQATKHDIHIYAKFGYLDVYRFLYTISFNFAFLEVYIMQ
jgi:hypothetical protein